VRAGGRGQPRAALYHTVGGGQRERCTGRAGAVQGGPGRLHGPSPDPGGRAGRRGGGRFLEHLERQGRTERHRKNVRNYLAQWAEALFEKDLQGLRLQDLKQLLNGWYDDAKKKVVAKRHRIAAIKSFFSWLREEEAVLTTAEDATLALKVPLARPEKAMRDKGGSMGDVERL